MEYYKLKISLQDYEDKLNRVILFNAENDLDELAFTILSIFNSLAYHLYLFSDTKHKYECEISYIESERLGYLNKNLSTFAVTIDSLILDNNKFEMIYDFGEDYTFLIEVLEKIESKDYYKISKVIDGVGYGIYEDNKYLLEEYLNGDKDIQLGLIDKGRFTNRSFDSFNLEECNNKLKRQIAKIRNGYLAYLKKIY